MSRFLARVFFFLYIWISEKNWRKSEDVRCLCSFVYTKMVFVLSLVKYARNGRHKIASRLIHLSQLADVVQMIFLKLKIRRAMNILRTSFCVWRRKMKTRSPIVIFGNQFCWLFIHQLILFLFSAVYNLDEQKGEENFCDRKFNQNYKNETKSAFEMFAQARKSEIIQIFKLRRRGNGSPWRASK